jgi:hypothetical protein
MVSAILSFVGLVIAGVISIAIYRAGRAVLRRKFREAAARDAKKFENKETIG